ncbi:peptidylprolyl isomerase [Rhodococcus sp. F64268]|uniref:peptidylprolyl isomerase n=1 Tax=unclassified Rhodococcus (in: high G+C Gram-positive bacteria) TaxID=192944 RepID=UPI001FF6041C|nr:peptidylprolyl isomerase [Rhodococcus sp. F64268]MCK0092258.1 peptidylprolyl isomerase [Rhodococcus sp. F64268]
MISPTSIGSSGLRGFAAAGVLLGATLTAGCSSGTAATPPPATTTQAPSHALTSEAVSRYPRLPETPPVDSPTVSCTYTTSGSAARSATLPSTSASTTGSAGVTFETSIGRIDLVLDRGRAPCTVNSFVSLARQGFYNGTSCHRLADEIGQQYYQCGDPTGTGTGGPGYTYPDEYPVQQLTAQTATGRPPQIVAYPRGTVAVADSGRADTNGSQFFLITGDTLLRPDYTAFARITDESLALLDAAAATGHDASSILGGGVPNTPVTITSVG